MTQTQHTDEPSVDELKRMCDTLMIVCYGPNDKEWKVANALRSRLSHPTLSADQEREVARLIVLGEIQESMPGWDDACIPDDRIDAKRPTAKMILAALKQ